MRLFIHVLSVELLDIFNSGETLTMDEEALETCNYYSQEAQKLTCELNGKYHEFDERREIFSELIGQELDENFRVFTPFYTDFGKNIHLGKNIFINADCKFQDQGGIYIGDDTLIGHNVVLATLNHEEDPENIGNYVKNGSCKLNNFAFMTLLLILATVA